MSASTAHSHSFLPTIPPQHRLILRSGRGRGRHIQSHSKCDQMSSSSSPQPRSSMSRYTAILPLFPLLTPSQKLKLPEADALPICRPIPAQLDITCRSKPLPASSSDDPSKFQFPRLPNSADVTLELVRIATVRAGGRKRVVTTSLQAFPVHVAKEINETSKPLWLPEYDEPDKGRWTENMSYATTLFLRCPPSFETKHIISKVRLIDKPLPHE
jgi:hypothetical protein